MSHVNKQGPQRCLFIADTYVNQTRAPERAHICITVEKDRSILFLYEVKIFSCVAPKWFCEMMFSLEYTRDSATSQLVSRVENHIFLTSFDFNTVNYNI